jgi:FtsZ-interacting cell division protein ZipA
MAHWPVRSIAAGVDIFAAISTWEFLARRYLPIILLAIVLVALLIKAHRLWQEIHEVDEVVTTDELLDSLEQAHADGELDDEEIERVRMRLKSDPAESANESANPSTRAVFPPAKPSASRDHVGTESNQSFDDLLP